MRLGRGTLVAVHAHPDDETLTTGGLLAAWAAAGGRVVVVTATRGERGETIGDDLRVLEGDGSALAAHRYGELCEALSILGVREHHFLDTLVAQGAAAPASWLEAGPDAIGLTEGGSGRAPAVRYEDSGMRWIAGSPGVARAADETPVLALIRASRGVQAAALSELLERLRPAVVVTYGPEGGYGHPDHVRVHEITLDAVAALKSEPGSACAERLPELWWCTSDPSAQAQAQLAVAHEAACRELLGQRRAGHREQLRVQDAPARTEDARTGTLTAAGAEGRAAPVRAVFIGDVASRVLAAMRSHRSQIQAVAAIHPPVVLEERVRTSDGAGTRPLSVIGRYALSNGILTALLDHEFYVNAVVPSALPEEDGTVAP